MKTFRKLIPIFILLVTILIFHSFYPIPVRQNNEQELLAKANHFNQLYPNEKIYLHLDRPSYWAGDDIWFKAYLLNSSISECNLYVELISSSGDVIDKKICWSQNGLAYGDFHLADSISSGVCQIRAYTNWMRNFEDDWFFRKNIIIWNLRDKEIETESEVLKTKDVDLQFFPEGGTFVGNLKNKMAFKATDKNGKAIAVKGEIVDDRGNKITDFKSSFKGMGSFIIEPQAGRKYTANATIANKIQLKIDLPLPDVDAIKLAIESNDSVKINIQVSANSHLSGNNQNAEYLIIGQTGGQICYRKEISISEKIFSLDIEKSTLPTGIIKFTLFDHEMIPRCERLVFVNHHDYVNIGIEPDKSEYLAREKVKLNVKAVTNNGTPCLANLSMSVYNPQNQMELETFPNNILTQFLLGSELKGIIEDPAWYFKDDSLSTLQALDNLMLTHGYRYFEWKEISENQYPEIVYQPENSIQVKGTVSNWLTKKPVKDCKVTMMFVKSQLAIHEQITDSLGNFLFTNLYFNDTVYVSLQAGDNKSRKNNWIELNNSSSISPGPAFLPVNYRYNNENQVKTTHYLSEVSSELLSRKWRLSDTILLGDINVLAKEHEEQSIHLRPYLDADYIFEVSKYDNIYVDIIDMLETTSAYMRRFLENDPQYFLDGVLVDTDFIVGLPASWFETVEAVKLAPGRTGFAPGIFFYTKRGETQKKIFDGAGMKSSEIIGYSVIRKFYSPIYESQEPVETKDDFRSTIYWDPVVQTDSTGIARVSFYNSDEAGNMQIVVEGIAADGKLCRGICTYIVKE
ncbi:MAG TPA: hypothetical protein VLQ91_19580 [Draconibacterium sp.]|nr:hypothetical protein [Draconibacterium sp.]